MSGHEIIVVIGEVAAIALAERFGGRRLYIAEKRRDEGQLERAIGTRAIGKLIAYYGAGATVRIPLLREQRLRRYHERGMSNAKIAARLGLTENGVGKALKRMRDQGQLKPAELCRT